MDIIEHILCKDLNIDTRKIKIPQFNIMEKHTLENYMEITRHFQEIDRLFEIFQFNLENLLTFYQLDNNDYITRNFEFNFTSNDNIIINSLIISYLSAGKTLTSSIEAFAKIHFGENSDDFKDFKGNCLNKIYDENFHYRLLIRLRDFAQHGHLPVTTIDSNNRCCFNLQNILYTPHYNHNKQLKQQIEKLIEDIHKQFSDYPHIAFTLSIVEFNICIIKIYLNFIDTITTLLTNSRKQIDLLLKKRPDIIHKSHDAFNGFVFYDYINNAFQCFNPKQDPIKMLFEVKNKLENLLNKEEANFKKLANNPTQNYINLE